MKEDWVVLCQARNQSIWKEEWTAMHEKGKEVPYKIGAQKPDQEVAGLGTVAWRKTPGED